MTDGLVRERQKGDWRHRRDTMQCEDGDIAGIRQATGQGMSGVTRN